MLNIKLAFQRWLIACRWNRRIKKSGHALYLKEKEIYEDYLQAGRRKDKEREQFLRGQLRLIEWQTSEKLI